MPQDLPDSCIKWRCGECHDLHDDEDDARDCCKPSVDEVYICPICRGQHYDEKRALECCDYINRDPDYVPPPTAAELEAQGQLRLIA